MPSRAKGENCMFKEEAALWIRLVCQEKRAIVS